MTNFILFISLLLIPLIGCSQNIDEPVILELKKNIINVNGKQAEIYRIEQKDGSWGYRGQKGNNFNVIVENNLDEPTSIHWHGLILPNNQDGVPFVTQEPIMPGQKYKYNFLLKQKGTYWMHSHHTMQTQEGLSAPLIIDDKNEEDYQEVIMFITDFSFKDPSNIWKELRKKDISNSISDMHDMNMGGMNMGDMNMGDMNMDLMDISYDAFLINYKTTSNPDIIIVEPKKKILLRIINAASATNFLINLGGLDGKVIAVDGEDIIPFNGSKFEIAMAQRMDILIDVAKNKGLFPIIAQGEGSKMQTGLILNNIDKSRTATLNDQANEVAPALGYNQELMLQAKNPLPNVNIDRSIIINLEGNMSDYIWKLNKEEWPNVTPIRIQENERIEIVFNNKTMMSHPMHLHGHIFQVTEINGKKINGAMRDTVNILPNSTIKIQFDANNPGIWMLHCHVLYHEMGGMMTIVNYNG